MRRREKASTHGIAIDNSGDAFKKGPSAAADSPPSPCSAFPPSSSPRAEATLGQVPSAHAAAFATEATSANPEAFAQVDGEGTVFPAYPKGIGTASVKQGPLPGTYCITAPTSSREEASRRGNSPSTAHQDASLYANVTGTEACPFPRVEVQAHTAGSRQKEPFFIVLYR